MEEIEPTVDPLLRAKRDDKKPSANVAKGGSLEMRHLCQQWDFRTAYSTMALEELMVHYSGLY